jgi:dipeptidyl aminopeptidase/acylaminoacyl peptidase
MVIICLLPAILLTVDSVQGQNRVETILAEADTWIITDTTRILTFIEESNQAALDRLKSSPHWSSTYDDLSFLMSIDYVGDPQMDNTGRMYYIMRITGQTGALFYTDEPMGFPHQLTPNNWDDAGYQVGYFLIHPSGDFLLVATHLHGNENYDIYKFNRDGSFEPLLMDGAIQFRQPVFKNSDEFFLISNDRTTQSLIKYTLSTGKIDTIYTEPGWFGPDDYHNGTILCTRWLSFSESQLFTVDEQTGQAQDLTDKHLYTAGFFTSDGRVVTQTSALSSEDEFLKFTLVDPQKPKKLELIYDPQVDTDEGFLVVQEKDIVVALLNTDGYSQLRAFDLQGQELEVPELGIGVIFGYAPSSIGYAANDLGDISYSFSSPNTAPSTYSFRLGSEKLTQWATVSTFGFDFSNIDVRLIHYPSEDSTKVPAFLYVPKTAQKNGRNPAAVVYHGGPPSQSRPYFQRNIAFALSRGLVMMFPNVRGSSGYGPAWEAADNLEGRFRALEDDIAAVDYLIDEGWSNPDQIAVWGASYGGYTVNYLATNWPDRFACIISEVGVADINYELTHGDLTFQSGWEKEYGPVGSDLIRRLSPIFKAENVARPMLVTAGFNDPRVFAGEPRRFGYLLKKLGKDVLYYEEVEGGHGGVTTSQVVEQYTRNYVFILDHIM